MKIKTDLGWELECSLNPKAQAVNKAQRQLRPEPYFPEFFKSLAQDNLNIYNFFSNRIKLKRREYNEKNVFDEMF